MTATSQRFISSLVLLSVTVVIQLMALAGSWRVAPPHPSPRRRAMHFTAADADSRRYASRLQRNQDLVDGREVGLVDGTTAATTRTARQSDHALVVIARFDDRLYRTDEVVDLRTEEVLLDLVRHEPVAGFSTASLANASLEPSRRRPWRRRWRRCAWLNSASSSHACACFATARAWRWR